MLVAASVAAVVGLGGWTVVLMGDRNEARDAAADDPSAAFALSRLDTPEMTHVPMGIFRQVARPTYDDQVRAQVRAAVDTAGGPAADADLADLLRGRDTWTVE